jgi:hypothetical protein
MKQGVDNLVWNVQVGASNKDIYGGDVKGKFGYGQRRII